MLFYIIICRVGDRTDQQTETEVVTATGSYITINWQIFLMKRALHFAAKLLN